MMVSLCVNKNVRIFQFYLVQIIDYSKVPLCTNNNIIVNAKLDLAL